MQNIKQEATNKTNRGNSGWLPEGREEGGAWEGKGGQYTVMRGD